MPLSIHHVAIICSDLPRAKRFYVDALGFQILAEHFREDRQSWKVDLVIDAQTQIELFSFPQPPARLTNPEACGLRHLAFRVDDLDEMIAHLATHGIVVETVRIDEYTQKRFTFVKDPDSLPIELYEV